MLNRIKSVSKISSQGEVTFDSSSDEDEEYLLKELERSMDNVP